MPLQMEAGHVSMFTVSNSSERGKPGDQKVMVKLLYLKKRNSVFTTQKRVKNSISHVVFILTVKIVVRLN